MTPVDANTAEGFMSLVGIFWFDGLCAFHKFVALVMALIDASGAEWRTSHGGILGFEEIDVSHNLSCSTDGPG